MAELIQQIFASPYDNGNPYNKGIQLRSEEFTRRLSFGDNWSRLRIAALVSFGMPAVPATVPGLVDIGVCSGGAGIGSVSPRLYIGAGWGATISGRTEALPKFDYTTVTGGWPVCGMTLGTAGTYSTSLEGTTITSFSSMRVQGQQSLYLPTSLPFQGVYRRGLVILDMLRVSSQVFSPYLYCDTSAAPCDMTIGSMMDACEQPFASTMTVAAYSLQTNAMVSLNAYSNYTTSTVQNKPYAGSAGPLDTVNISWNLSQFPMSIWAVAVARFA